jgi:hypothetical protein
MGELKKAVIRNNALFFITVILLFFIPNILFSQANENERLPVKEIREEILSLTPIGSSIEDVIHSN